MLYDLGTVALRARNARAHLQFLASGGVAFWVEEYNTQVASLLASLPAVVSDLKRVTAWVAEDYDQRLEAVSSLTTLRQQDAAARAVPEAIADTEGGAASDTEDIEASPMSPAEEEEHEQEAAPARPAVASAASSSGGAGPTTPALERPWRRPREPSPLPPGAVTRNWQRRKIQRTAQLMAEAAVARAQEAAAVTATAGQSLAAGDDAGTGAAPAEAPLARQWAIGAVTPQEAARGSVRLDMMVSAMSPDSRLRQELAAPAVIGSASSQSPRPLAVPKPPLPGHWIGATAAIGAPGAAWRPPVPPAPPLRVAGTEGRPLSGPLPAGHPSRMAAELVHELPPEWWNEASRADGPAGYRFRIRDLPQGVKPSQAPAYVVVK